MQVLLIDPVPQQAHGLENGLREAGHVVEVMSALPAVLGPCLAQTAYDVAIAEASSPSSDGLAVVRVLRQHSRRLPLILLTAADPTQRARALDLGADDCLSRPFAFAELLARIRALQRRGTAGRPALLRAGDLVVDPATHRAWRGTRAIGLTRREFALLEYFLRNAGFVLARPMILDHVWGLGFDTESNIIDVYVGYLREKIDGPRDRPLLHTVRGVGYVLRTLEPSVLPRAMVASPRAGGCPPPGRPPRMTDLSSGFSSSPAMLTAVSGGNTRSRRSCPARFAPVRSDRGQVH